MDGQLGYDHYNTLFIEGREYLEQDMIRRKFVPFNAYYGRIAEGTFPAHSGYTQRGFKLGRQAPPDEFNWRKLEQTQCGGNACDFDPDVIPMNSSEDYTWFAVAMDLRTDWLCLDRFLAAMRPEEEVAHIEDGLSRINQYINEEFTRTWYLDACEKKWVGLLPMATNDLEYLPDEVFKIATGCGCEAFDDFWAFETYANGLPNPNRIRVKVPYTQLYRISALALDVLDTSIIPLEREGDYIQEGVRLFDLVIPDMKISRQLQAQDNVMNDGYKSNGYNAGDLDRSLGIDRTVGNYTLRRDPYAPRYNPAPIAEQPLASSFDPDSPDTWALLVRVFPFRQVNKYSPGQNPNMLGVKHIPNRDYDKAAFGISQIFQPRVGRLERMPDTSGYGTARKADYTAEGYFHWKNPDWPTNIKRNNGFWMACYRLAWHPRETDLGNAFLHRLDHRIRLVNVPCDIETAKTRDPVTPYQCAGVSGDPSGNGEGFENLVTRIK